MSKAQSCANVMRRYKLAYAGDKVKQGCFDATIKELERQELRIATLERENAELRETLAMARLKGDTQFPHHPEPHVMRWSDLERDCITKYAANVRREATNAALERAACEFDKLERERPMSVIHCASVSVRLRVMKEPT